MKKLILISLLLFTTSQITFAQQAIAKIKFNEAEEAYAAKDYTTAITKLDEVESILKSTNPKVMYLRIMAQSETIKNSQFNEYKIIQSTRNLCSKYLKDYENLPNNEDKYIDIYKISTSKFLLVSEDSFNTEKQKISSSNEVLLNKLINSSNNLLDLNGSSVAFKSILQTHKGKTTVIEIWGSWCDDCIKNIPNIKELQTSHTNADFVFLSSDKNINNWKNAIKQYDLKGDHYSIPNGMNSAFGKSIDLDWIPNI